MHKKLVNHCTLELTLIPDGPILIKSGRQGADPTKPDMEFVEYFLLSLLIRNLCKFLKILRKYFLLLDIIKVNDTFCLKVRHDLI
jgi:hypothetical protein